MSLPYFVMNMILLFIVLYLQLTMRLYEEIDIVTAVDSTSIVLQGHSWMDKLIIHRVDRDTALWHI